MELTGCCTMRKWTRSPHPASAATSIGVLKSEGENDQTAGIAFAGPGSRQSLNDPLAFEGGARDTTQRGRCLVTLQSVLGLGLGVRSGTQENLCCLEISLPSSNMERSAAILREK